MARESMRWRPSMGCKATSKRTGRPCRAPPARRLPLWNTFQHLEALVSEDMPRFRRPTYPEWGLLVAIVVMLACIGLGLSVVYNRMERASQSLEEAGKSVRP